MNSILPIILFLTRFGSSALSVCLQPSSCAELYAFGNDKSGVYTIHPRVFYGLYPFQVYCDMYTDGGGWTVFQRRDDYEVQENFFREWDDYKNGFGNLNNDFWLGNTFLYVLTNQDRVTLRVDLEDFLGNKRVAEFKEFQIADEANNYKLTISGYHGTAGDGLTDRTGALFTTIDKNDVHTCSKQFKGGWWYTNCHATNPNGLYLRGNHSSFADGVNWYHWLGHHYSLKRTELKIRPINYSPRAYMVEKLKN